MSLLLCLACVFFALSFGAILLSFVCLSPAETQIVNRKSAKYNKKQPTDKPAQDQSMPSILNCFYVH